ncbi:LysM peptidoglycan-binding domain-containing protein [Nocardioides sp. Bht2]|uniref:LysM peptidoglycan-binding domain-containing protein n=1 Tax=Nocardioides sp. Bht2 TaxID=3392297 RepID=UPI0039B40C81
MSSRDSSTFTTPHSACRRRCFGTWLAATALSVAALAGSWRARPASWATWARLDGTPSPPLPDQLLVAAAQATVVGAVLWLWLLSTLLVADVARGRPSRVGAPRWLRYLVLLGCGALLATATLPAHAQQVTDANSPRPVTPTGRNMVAGLPLPELPTTAPAAPAAPAVVTVTAGDTLWRIAERALPPGTSRAEIDRAAGRLWLSNRPTIGVNPDLIRPGQQLDLSSLRGLQ